MPFADPVGAPGPPFSPPVLQEVGTLGLIHPFKTQQKGRVRGNGKNNLARRLESDKTGYDSEKHGRSPKPTPCSRSGWRLHSGSEPPQNPGSNEIDRRCCSPTDSRLQKRKEMGQYVN